MNNEFTRLNKTPKTFISPAKLNLFLKITGKRSDGYHDLASLFQTITLCDSIDFQLDFTTTDQDQLTCTDPSILCDESNLILKACNHFRQKTKHIFSLKVHLTKNIPHEAGLGGGSSNAATTLWALNSLCGSPADISELMSWAGEIGSDVAFFLADGTAYCTKKGEVVRKLPLLPDALQEKKLHIIKPKQGLSTPEVYKRLDLEKLTSIDPEQALLDFYSGNQTFFNDLEEPAFEIFPKLIQLKQKLLNSGFEQVLLCGSGSSLFCIGNADLPDLSNDDVDCISSEFLNRDSNSWYTLTKTEKVAL